MEKAVLVGLITSNSTTNQTKEYLDELEFLAKTAGADPIKKFTQRLAKPDNNTFLGKGKIDEVYHYAKSNDVSIIIFDDDLSPTQIRNIERIFNEKSKILDRSNLILDIFGVDMDILNYFYYILYNQYLSLY